MLFVRNTVDPTLNFIDYAAAMMAVAVAVYRKHFH